VKLMGRLAKISPILIVFIFAIEINGMLRPKMNKMSDAQTPPHGT